MAVCAHVICGTASCMLVRGIARLCCTNVRCGVWAVTYSVLGLHIRAGVHKTLDTLCMSTTSRTMEWSVVVLSVRSESVWVRTVGMAHTPYNDTTHTAVGCDTALRDETVRVCDTLLCVRM